MHQGKIEPVLRDGEAGLELAMQVGRLGRWELELGSGRLSCDDRWYAIMGRDPAQPIGTIAEFRPFIHPDDVVRVTEVPDTITKLAARDEDYGVEFRILRPDGEIRWMRSLASLSDEQDGLPRRATGFVMDVTETVRLRDELQQTCRALVTANARLAMQKSRLQRLSLTDGLTGIANRRCFDIELARAVSRVRGPGTMFTVALIDIDHFKRFNDGYGHVEGDTALRAVADALKAAARRRSDLAARYGGEEFALLLPGCDSPAKMLASVTRKIRELNIRHDHSPVAPVLTVSIGGVIVHTPGESSRTELLRQCDEALYRAKHAGRNQVILHEAGTPGLQRHDNAA